MTKPHSAEDVLIKNMPALLPDPSAVDTGCVGAATFILGDKWTPLLLQFLSQQESARFCQIQDALGGINPRTLSARLVKLESQNILLKQSFAEMPPRTEYSLTNRGKDLIPILELMAEWSQKYGLCSIDRS